MTAPKPGSGPSKEIQRQTGFWKLLLIGYPESPPKDDPNAHVTVKLEDNNGDPGYWSTSAMLVECALSLVLDAEAVAQTASQEGTFQGVCGWTLIPRGRANSRCCIGFDPIGSAEATWLRSVYILTVLSRAWVLVPCVCSNAFQKGIL